MEMVVVCNVLLIWLASVPYVLAALCYQMVFVLQIVPQLRCTLQVECATTVTSAARIVPLLVTVAAFDVLSATIIIVTTVLKPALQIPLLARLLEPALVSFPAASVSTQLLIVLLVLTLLYLFIREAALAFVQVRAT
jgi:hypothetical protein